MSALDHPTSDEYTTFCEGVRRLSKIDLSQYKRGQMERRIRTFAERRGTPDLTEYLRILRERPEELDEFLDRVTINVSQLWRNPEQWTALASEILPELAQAGGRVRVWSAGSSYGAEAYTVAALCREHIPGARAEVLGTDIDKRMVERARLGRFSPADARDAPADALARYFERTPDGWQATSEVKRLVSFEVGDLLTMRMRGEAFDLVLCRNTVIYFNEDVRDALHARLVASIRPGGYLIVGSTERVSNARELGLASPRPFVYRKAV